MTNENDEMSAASRGSASGTQGFTAELSDLLNRHSMEGASGTPDYILAKYITDCLLAWNQSMQEREAWYGRKANPDMTGCYGRATVVPLYRSPALTDEEREAMEWAEDASNAKRAAAIRGLLKRLGRERQGSGAANNER